MNKIRANLVINLQLKIIVGGIEIDF